MAKGNKIQAIRGMNDVLPQQTPNWQYLERVMRTILSSYSYEEIRFPVLEQTQLFKRSIGEVTDIVEKEMYTFNDRNGDSLTLRPEGTACCVRAAEQHGLLFNQTQKLWYMGPMYRHERPQKGRYRQFYQLGVEAFGMAGIDIEAELIVLTADLWERLGLSPFLQLEVNNLGEAFDRARYGVELTAYLQQYESELDADSQRRLKSNVLRILDSKSPQTQAILEGAPKLSDFIDADSQTSFNALLLMLKKAGIQPHINPSLVRGLDYYNGIVFEWTTDKLGAQATVCAGGRFDGLSKQLGGSVTPAVGFAMGMERLLLLLEELDLLPVELKARVDVYIAVIGDNLQTQALLLAREIRQQYPGLRVLTHCGGGKYKSQLKKAFNSGARCALIFEDNTPAFSELKQVEEINEVEEIKVKMLNEQGDTHTVQVNVLQEWLRDLFNKHNNN